MARFIRIAFYLGVGLAQGYGWDRVDDRKWAPGFHQSLKYAQCHFVNLAFCQVMGK